MGFIDKPRLTAPKVREINDNAEVEQAGGKRAALELEERSSRGMSHEDAHKARISAPPGSDRVVEDRQAIVARLAT